MVLNGTLSGKFFCLLPEKENITEYHWGGSLRLFHNLHFFFIPERIAKILNEKILGLPDVNPLDSRSKYSVSIPGLCAMRLSPFRAL